MTIINDGGLKPGIYFDLPAKKYHEDRALSRSNLIDLLDTANTYWVKSWMNPERSTKKISSDDMDYGEAFHTLLFEPKKFSSRYQVVPIDAWDVRKEKIEYDDYFAMVESIKVLRAGKDSKLFLSGGLSEVTIVFDFNDVRYRVRIDFLTPAIACVDFKTTFSLSEWKLKQSFEKFGYDIQIFLYKLAILCFRRQLAAGEASIYGKVAPEFLRKFMAAKLAEFIFIFQRKTPPYPFLPLMPEDDTEENGQRRASEATEIFIANFNKYGTKPWPVCEGKIKSFSMSYGIREGNI